MGYYAKTDYEITCASANSAKKVAMAIRKMKKKSDKWGNFQSLTVKQEGESVFGFCDSNRDVNLTYQCNKIWDEIKDLSGVIRANFPFLVEADGEWFENEEGGDEI